MASRLLLPCLLTCDLVMLFPATILGRCAVGVKVATRTNHAPVRGVGLKAMTDDIGAKPCIAFPGRAMR